MSDFYKISSAELESFCTEIFTAAGVEKKAAEITARSLVDADLRNVISHGVTRIGNYLDRLQKGGTNPHPNIRLIHETPTTALLDGDDCLGAVVAEQAVELAREKAKAQGMAFVAVRRSNHYGAAARWAQKLAGTDMIGITGSNVEPVMCVTGGRSRGIGNNPFSYAFPSKKFGMICYDVACSIMAGGKVLDYVRENKPLPEGCFCDAQGAATTDPTKAALMLPFGGHKGFGLAVVVEMLSSVLSGGCYGESMGSQYGKPDSPNHISHYFAAIDIAALRPLEEYYASADGFVEYLQALPRYQDKGRILYPGQLENESKAEKLVSGIPMTTKQVEELEHYAVQAGLPVERAAFLRTAPVL